MERGPHRAVLVICLIHAVLPLIVIGPHLWFGIDETVYLSQINAHVPAGLFSAPRARGLTFIAAPVTLVTNSVTAVRVYLAMLSGIGLYAGLRPWLRLHLGYVVPVAALLFSSIWTSIYYSFEVMPNEWVAYAAVAATGLTLLHWRHPERRATLPLLTIALCATALLRPSDSLYLGVALAIAALSLPSQTRRRRLAGVIAIAGGAVLGWAEWIVEAEVSYGGFLARVHAAQAENGGGGLHFALLAQLRTLAGPVLCRQGCHASAPLVDQLWWVGIPLLLAVGVAASIRQRNLPLVVVPMLAGSALAAEYTFTVDYAAPRFLTPAYALLAVPCAYGAVALFRRTTTRWLPVLAVAAGACFVAHTALQVGVIRDDILPVVTAGNNQLLSDASLLRAAGLQKPCLILGEDSYDQSIAFADGCTNTPGDDASVLNAVRHGVRTVWLTPDRPPASTYGSTWRMVRLDQVDRRGPGLRAYLSFPARN